MPKKYSIFDRSALAFHADGRPGKLEITATKSLTTQHDLSLAYSPGVAAPCMEIAENPEAAYDYTAKSNTVAVISNGTAVLGLGNIGAAASKPVMEGKAVLFKKFADIDGIDIEVDSEDIDRFVDAVSLIGDSFGGINLEDIKSPECFVIEERLLKLMNVPVFHDDQHGTAIIVAAGLINAFDLTGRDIKKVKIVSTGAGAASIACVELLKTMGVPHNNVTMVDEHGVIYKGRKNDSNPRKDMHAIETDKRTLEEAVKDADVFLGLSVGNLMTQQMVKSMAPQPIIFAMANPVPEIMPSEAHAARKDVIIATGRSDFPNQVNNVLVFPYIFRGALDVRASAITQNMKIAAAQAIADLARADIHDKVSAAYDGRTLTYGRDYIIPAPFDPRLIVKVSSAVAKAAMQDKVARKKIDDLDEYRNTLTARIDPTATTLQKIFGQIKDQGIRVVFAEGEEESMLRAAVAFQNAGYGKPIMVARRRRLKETVERIGLEGGDDLECINAKISNENEAYIDNLYTKLQRNGAMRRDCQRMVNQDRNVFAASMIMAGDADAMVTGTTRSFKSSFSQITRLIEPKNGRTFMASSLVISRGSVIFIGDTSVNENPDAETIANIAEGLAEQASIFGYTPRVAILAFSNFGSPQMKSSYNPHQAVEVLDKRGVNFEYDGEMTPEVALDYTLMRKNYPFCRLSGPANVLVMPGLHAANISFQMLKNLGGGSVVGPIISSASAPFQIVQMGATSTEILHAAAFAAFDVLTNRKAKE